MISIHPIEASSVAPQTGEMSTGAHFTSTAYLPVLTHSIIPLAPLARVTPSSSAPAPLLKSQSQSPANGYRPGTQKEEELSQLEQELLSLPWYAANAAEPPCSSPECPTPQTATVPAGCLAAQRLSSPRYLRVVCLLSAENRGRCEAPAVRSFQPRAVFVCPANGTVW